MIFKVYFYYYYLAYTKVVPDVTPHFTSVFVFGMLCSFLIVGITDVVAIKLYCTGISEFLMFGMATLCLLLSFLLYFRYGKGEKIVSEKPKFWGSHHASLTIVLITSLTIMSWMFWGGIYTRNLLANCR